MSNFNVDFPLDFQKIEDRITEVTEEPLDAPRMATAKVQLKRKNLNNYEQKMRSHAERCLAGR